MKRHYETRFYTHRARAVPTTPAYVTSDASIRVVAVVMFRKVFGRCPDYTGRWTGGAIAKDRRGNRVHIDQVNFDSMPGFDLRTGRFPLTLIAA